MYCEQNCINASFYYYLLFIYFKETTLDDFRIKEI